MDKCSIDSPDEPLFINSKQAYMNSDLSFQEKQVEDLFRKSRKGYNGKSFRLYLICLLIIFLLNWVINPFDLDNFSGLRLIFHITNIFFLLILIIVFHFKKDFKHPELGIMFIQFYICVGYIELNRVIIERDFKKTNFIVTTIFLELNLVTSFVSRSLWKSNAFSTFLLNLYMAFRWGEFSLNYEQRGFPALVFLENFLVILITSFFLEKFERISFYKQLNYEKTLENLVHIMKEVLPSAIILFRGDKLLFKNNETERILEVQPEETLEEKLKEVSVINVPSVTNFFNPPSPLKKKLDSQTPKTLASNVLYDYFTQSHIFNNERDFLLLNGSFQKYNKGQENYANNEVDAERATQFLEIKIGKIIWDGQDAIMAIISEDFAAKRMQYLREQAEYKDCLLATVSHDLRTPLNGVIGILDLTLEGVSDKVMRKNLELALRSSHWLQFMINDILDFTQISKGTLRINPVDFAIDEMIKDLIKLIKFQVKQKGLQLIIENNLPRQENLLFSDLHRIKQVLLNLLGNAVKFTEAGFIKVRIEKNFDQGQQSRSFVKFSVEDTGLGIKEKDIPKLFKLFGMIKNEKSKQLNKRGIGLGLAISQKLVKILNNNQPGAAITLKSEYGKGSVFSFPIHAYSQRQEKPSGLLLLEQENSIPARKYTGKKLSNADDEEEYLLTEDYQKEPILCQEFKSNYSVFSSEPYKKRILLVDDDQINILVLTKIIGKFSDCQYSVASNGVEAVNIVQKTAQDNLFFDFIFMDLNMPVMGGIEASEKILEMVSKKEIPSVKIIASTADASQADFDNCFKCGMSGYISKPFTKKIVREKIDLLSKTS